MRRRRRVSDAPGEKPPFGHQKSAERDFERKLNKVAGEIRKILENAKSEADLRVAQNRLREYAKLLGKWADIQAEQMVNRVFEANEKRWGGFVKEFGYDLKEKKGKEAAEKSDIAKAVIKMRTEAAKYIKDLPEGTAERVGHLAHEAMLHGMRPEAIQERIQNECEVSASRARLIARTEVARSNSVLVQARAESLGSEAYIWQTAEDGRVRESHREMNGKVCYWKDPPVLSDATQTHPGQIFNCFPGSTYVDLSYGCHKLWRRRYHGFINELAFSDGTILQATPNHPILTGNGWLAVNDLHEGDHVLQSFDEPSRVGENTEDIFITSFDDFWNALRVFKTAGIVSETTMGTEFDFHGDGTKNDVDVIDIERFLKGDVISALSKFRSDLGFSASDVTYYDSLLDALRGQFESPGGIAVTHRFIGVFYQLALFIKRHTGHSDVISFRSGASRNVMLSQNSGDDSTRDVIPQREGGFAFTGSIGRDNIKFGQIKKSSVGGLVGGSEPDATFFKVFGHFVAGSENTLDVGEGMPFNCKPLRLVNKRGFNFCGHVYNLQSDCGYYTATSNKKTRGIYVHNCRCIAIPLLSDAELQQALEGNPGSEGTDHARKAAGVFRGAGGYRAGGKRDA